MEMGDTVYLLCQGMNNPTLGCETVAMDFNLDGLPIDEIYRKNLYLQGADGWYCPRCMVIMSLRTRVDALDERLQRIEDRLRGATQALITYRAPQRGEQAP